MFGNKFCTLCTFLECSDHFVRGKVITEDLNELPIIGIRVKKHAVNNVSKIGFHSNKRDFAITAPKGYTPSKKALFIFVQRPSAKLRCDYFSAQKTFVIVSGSGDDGTPEALGLCILANNSLL